MQHQYTRGVHRIATWAHLTNAHIFPGPAIVTALKAAAASTLQSLVQNVSTEITTGTPRISSDGEEADDCDFGRGGGERPSENSGRKGSVVTATTTISQTVEGSQRTPASMARAVSAGEGDDGDREEALEALGEPPLARGLLIFAQMSSQGNLMDSAYTKKCVTAARADADFVIGYIAQRSLNESKKDNFISFTPGVNLPAEGVADSAARKGDGLGQQYRTPEIVVAKDGCDIIIVGRGILEAENVKQGKTRAQEAERYREAAWKAYEARVGKKGR